VRTHGAKNVVAFEEKEFKANQNQLRRPGLCHR